ncbi:hypothetical protein [Streptomyces atroolivaceus]|uniref:hypothetical protein n=1 Tax=Streptomyces atroolivaceus TaxID=66869 RepID=UPI00368F61AA
MDRQDSVQRAEIDRIIDPLKTNMPKAGDFSFEAIQQLGNPGAATGAKRRSNRSGRTTG